MHTTNPIPNNGPLVVKLGGAAIDDAPACAALWDALASMHAAQPGSLVLVHGGGAAVDRRLARLGLVSERIEGIRVTTPEILDEVVATLAGSTSAQVVGQLQRRGVPAVGTTLAAGFFARAAKTTRYPFDIGRVGDVGGGSPGVALALLAAGCMPVFSSIALDSDGVPLNINADEAAAGAAAILRARALVMLTDVEGVCDGAGALIPELTPADIDARIASGEITGGMIPKVRSAMQAATVSGAPCVIASWKRPGALRAIGAGQRVGTWLTPGAPAPLTEATP
ncbi:MAG: acetylglutamate kinase [Phycisphaerales bacterium]